MGVERFYSGIISPSGGMYQGTDGGGVYDGILPGASGAPSGQSAGLTQQQLRALQAIRAVPTNSYQQLANQPLSLPNEPRGFSFADTGDYGRASGPMTQQLAIAGAQPSMLAGMFGRGITAPGGALDNMLAYVESARPRITPAAAAASALAGTSLSSMFSAPRALLPPTSPAQAAARAANFGGGREVINSNGNYVTPNGEWHYSDPAHSGFTPISNNQSLG